MKSVNIRTKISGHGGPAFVKAHPDLDEARRLAREKAPALLRLFRALDRAHIFTSRDLQKRYGEPSAAPETPVSDPTPELRERIEALRPSKDRFLSAYEEGRRDAIYDVLDVLGEPK